MQPEICTKMHRNLSEKLAEKFFATTLSYSMVKIALLDDAFSEIFELEVGPVEGQSLRQKDKRRKRKGENQIQKTEKPNGRRSFSRNFDFGGCPGKNVVKLDASEKKGYTLFQNGRHFSISLFT